MDKFLRGFTWQSVAYAIGTVLLGLIAFIASDMYQRQGRADAAQGSIFQRLSGIEATQVMQQTQMNQIMIMLQQIQQTLMDSGRERGRR